MPFETSVAPALVHLAPAFAAAKEDGELVIARAEITKAISVFLISRIYSREDNSVTQRTRTSQNFYFSTRMTIHL